MRFNYSFVWILALMGNFVGLSLAGIYWPWSMELDRGGSFEKKKCDWIQNKRMSSNELNKKRKTIETCLFDILVEKAEQKGVNNLAFEISDPPPITWGSNKAVTILVHDIVIKRFHGHIRESSLNSIGGKMSISWIDTRFQWDPEEWHIRSMPMYRHQIWEPESGRNLIFFASKRDEAQFISGSSENNFEDIKISYNGNVTAKMTFLTKVQCSSDEYNYPTETVHCCFDFQPSKVRNKIRTYKIASGAEKLSGRAKQSYSRLKGAKDWRISDVELIARDYYDSEYRDDSENRDGTKVLKICVEAKRSSVTLKLELNWPAAASAAAFLIAGLFQSIRAQIYARMFAVLIQILCMQRLYDQHNLNYLSKTPKIFLFYEITIMFTLVSFTFTLIFVGLYKNLKRISFAPPEHLLNVTNFLNRFWLPAKGTNVNDDDEDDEEHFGIIQNFCTNGVGPGCPGVVNENLGNPVLKENKENYVSVWRQQFLALNDLMTFFLAMLYIVIILFLWI